MTVGKDSRIFRVENVRGYGERSVREWGRIVLAKGRPKREIREGAVGEENNVFSGQTFTFDYCTCMIGRHSVGIIFLDLHCKLVVCYLSVSRAWFVHVCTKCPNERSRKR